MAGAPSPRRRGPAGPPRPRAALTTARWSAAPKLSMALTADARAQSLDALLSRRAARRLTPPHSGSPGGPAPRAGAGAEPEAGQSATKVCEAPANGRAAPRVISGCRRREALSAERVQPGRGLPRPPGWGRPRPALPPGWGRCRGRGQAGPRWGAEWGGAGAWKPGRPLRDARGGGALGSRAEEPAWPHQIAVRSRLSKDPAPGPRGPRARVPTVQLSIGGGEAARAGRVRPPLCQAVPSGSPPLRTPCCGIERRVPSPATAGGDLEGIGFLKILTVHGYQGPGWPRKSRRRQSPPLNRAGRRSGGG